MTRRSKRKASAKASKKLSTPEEGGDGASEEAAETLADAPPANLDAAGQSDGNVGEEEKSEESANANEEKQEEPLDASNDNTTMPEDVNVDTTSGTITSVQSSAEQVADKDDTAALAVEPSATASDANLTSETTDQEKDQIKEDETEMPENSKDDAVNTKNIAEEAESEDVPMEVDTPEQAEQVSNEDETPKESVSSLEQQKSEEATEEASGDAEAHDQTDAVDENALPLEQKDAGQSPAEETKGDTEQTKEDDIAQVDLTVEDDASSSNNQQEAASEPVETAQGGDVEMQEELKPFCIPKDNSDEKNTPEDEPKTSKDSAVIEIGSADDSNGDSTSPEKEPVVIELGTNDDLTEGNDSPEDKSSIDGFQVVDEIDLTKSDDEEMDVGKEEPKNFEADYVVPDYDDPNLITLEIDPEQDNGSKAIETKDFLKYWHPVQDSPQEFTSWTYLLQFVEQDGKLPLARKAFNSFFLRYPLCYGYWKKFSELERKSGNFHRAQKILERGVRAIPLSVDLWVHVIDFYINYYNKPDANTDKIRTLFDRAIKAAGQEFRSEKLWNKYVKWEIENKNWLGVVATYDRALRAPTQHYSILFSDFKSFVNKHSPQELLTEAEFREYLMETRKEATTDGKGEKAENKEEEESKEKEIDDAPPGVEDEDKPPTDEELKAIRTRIVRERKKVHDETEQFVTKIWAFEEGIKRPYFHVKQLERAQLKNWREYLDVEIGKEDHERVVLLFERCLIACALYEDFWLKYSKYMAKHDLEATSRIFQRACSIHLPKKPNIHIQWAAHEEMQGDLEKASEILENLDNVLPGLAMIRMRRVALERRANNVIAAEDLLKSYVASAAKDKEEIFYSRKLAWFLVKVSNKKEEGKKILKELLPKYKSEAKLYNDLVEMEFQCAGADYPADESEEGMAMESFNIALSSDKLNDDQKFVFSQRKLEFLEDFGRDVKHLQKAYDEHQKLVRSHKKRTQIDLTGDEAPNKKAKVDNTSIAVVGTSQLSNGASYTGAATTTSYGTQQASYAAGDPNLYYQQQQSYWNYAKPADTQAQQQYNYSQQWSQYYGGSTR